MASKIECYFVLFSQLGYIWIHFGVFLLDFFIQIQASLFIINLFLFILWLKPKIITWKKDSLHPINHRCFFNLSKDLIDF